jgi:hypothetical protein
MARISSSVSPKMKKKRTVKIIRKYNGKMTYLFRNLFRIVTTNINRKRQNAGNIVPTRTIVRVELTVIVAMKIFK